MKAGLRMSVGLGWRTTAWSVDLKTDCRHSGASAGQEVLAELARGLGRRGAPDRGMPETVPKGRVAQRVWDLQERWSHTAASSWLQGPLGILLGPGGDHGGPGVP